MSEQALVMGVLAGLALAGAAALRALQGEKQPEPIRVRVEDDRPRRR